MNVPRCKSDKCTILYPSKEEGMSFDTYVYLVVLIVTKHEITDMIKTDKAANAVARLKKKPIFFILSFIIILFTLILLSPSIDETCIR